MRYIGFDMGDGESAVAVYENGSGIEPVIKPLCGSRSLLSAVGTVGGEIVVGERAYTDTLAEGLEVRFKSRFTDDPTSYDTIVRFAKGVLNELRASGVYTGEEAFVVGCPAGWNAACRARYRDLLIRAGVREPQVISESRAAFLYAKYAKTVALDLNLLRESALVIDVGSSTLDFAYIVDGRETGIGTFGETHLGGGLLDAELLRLSVERSRDRDALNAVFKESRSWYSYCEIEARKLKEQYFTQAAQDASACVKKQLRVCYDGVQKLQLQMDADEEHRLTHEPLASLNGRSFAQALQSALDEAKAVTAEHPPALVLLTGGASRMAFFRDQCRAAFADAVVVCCPEPEFSIAKGLAYAGWVDENLRAFRKAIAEEVTDERVGEIARQALPQLTPAVADALVKLTVDEAAVPIAEQWKRGEIDTLAEMNERMQRRTERVLASPLAEETLAPIVGAWVEGLTGDLQTMIFPICDRYDVPREEMKLCFVSNAQDVKITSKELLGFDLVGKVAAVLLSVVGALLCGGGGVALIATGPLGMLAGAAVGAVVAAFGWNAVTELVMKAKLPRALRLMNVDKRLHGEQTTRTLHDAVMKEIGGEDSEFSKQAVAGFTDAFQKYLHSIASAAEIPIR